MRQRLLKLYEVGLEIKDFRKDLLQDLKDIEDVINYQSLSYGFEVIYSKIISYYNNNPFIGHFRIQKTRKFITRKYFYLTFRQNIKAYIKGSDVYLSLKIVCHNLYPNL